MQGVFTLSPRKSDISSPFRSDIDLKLDNSVNIFSQKQEAAKQQQNITPARETRISEARLNAAKKLNRFEQLLKSSPLVGASSSGISIYA